MATHRVDLAKMKLLGLLL